MPPRPAEREAAGGEQPIAQRQDAVSLVVRGCFLKNCGDIGQQRRTVAGKSFADRFRLGFGRREQAVEFKRGRPSAVRRRAFRAWRIRPATAATPTCR